MNEGFTRDLLVAHIPTQIPNMYYDYLSMLTCFSCNPPSTQRKTGLLRLLPSANATYALIFSSSGVPCVILATTRESRFLLLYSWLLQHFYRIIETIELTLYSLDHYDNYFHSLLTLLAAMMRLDMVASQEASSCTNIMSSCPSYTRWRDSAPSPTIILHVQRTKL